MKRTRLIVATLALPLAAACSSTSNGTSATDTSTTTSVAQQASAACTALPSFDQSLLSFPSSDSHHSAASVRR